jgi:hypothetical protein
MELQGIDEFYEKQRSDRWTYSATPRFELETGKTRLEVSKGVVVRADGPLSGAVEGKPFAEVAVSLLCPVD